MKVYIGLIYVDDQCRVECVRTTREAAEKHLRRAINKKVKNPDKLRMSGHVISKSIALGDLSNTLLAKYGLVIV